MSSIQKVGVKILPRFEVLDIQGRAVADTLKNHGKKLMDCRVGRYVVLEIPDVDKAEALQRAKEMAEFVLHNPLIETFELEHLGQK